MTDVDCHTEEPHYIAERIPWRPGPGAAFVYTLYGFDGEVVYVGFTTNLIARLAAHQSSSDFKHLVGFAEWEEWDTIEQATRRETWLIGFHNPPWNIRGRTDTVVWPPPTTTS